MTQTANTTTTAKTKAQPQGQAQSPKGEFEGAFDAFKGNFPSSTCPFFATWPRRAQPRRVRRMRA